MWSANNKLKWVIKDKFRNGEINFSDKIYKLIKAY